VDITLILVHHVGAKSGIDRVSPLAHSLQGNRRFAIWAEDRQSTQTGTTTTAT
jgi:hypothetical protein